MTARSKVLRPLSVAVAPPWLGVASSAAAAPAVTIAPAATRPEARTAAARRAERRLFTEIMVSPPGERQSVGAPRQRTQNSGAPVGTRDTKENPRPVPQEYQGPTDP